MLLWAKRTWVECPGRGRRLEKGRRKVSDTVVGSKSEGMLDKAQKWTELKVNGAEH